MCRYEGGGSVSCFISGCVISYHMPRATHHSKYTAITWGGGGGDVLIMMVVAGIPVCLSPVCRVRSRYPPILTDADDNDVELGIDTYN